MIRLHAFMNSVPFRDKSNLITLAVVAAGANDSDIETQNRLLVDCNIDPLAHRLPSAGCTSSDFECRFSNSFAAVDASDSHSFWAVSAHRAFRQIAADGNARLRERERAG